jgi:diguanylate cyclase (GGDEF)-like protein
MTRSLVPLLQSIVGRALGQATGRSIGRANVFGLMREPVVLLDGRDRIVDVNPAFERRLAAMAMHRITLTDAHEEAALMRTTGGTLGRPSLVLLGRALSDVLPDLDAALEAEHTDGMVLLQGDLDGWAATVETLTGRRGRRLGRTVILRDVRVERARERWLRFQADRDPLTGVFNRRAFDAMLAQALADPGGVVTLAFLDLDDFKDINDFYGHATGDVVLIETTRRLTAALRDADALGRIGGDEFAVALLGLDRHASMPVIERLRRALEPLYEVDAATIRIQISLGAATAPEDGRDVPALMAAADAAMYRVKHARRDVATLVHEPGGEGPPR